MDLQEKVAELEEVKLHIIISYLGLLHGQKLQTSSVCPIATFE